MTVLLILLIALLLFGWGLFADLVWLILIAIVVAMVAGWGWNAGRWR